jgi:DNA polymerase-3 subunit delta
MAEFEQIKTAILKKELHPVYFLHGLESYYLDLLTHLFEQNVLEESEKAFNFTIYYGKDSDARMIVDTAVRLPMMAERQLIIVKEAQDLKDLAKLESYVLHPNPQTVLVLVHKHKKLNLTTKFGKIIKANTTLFESKPLYENQVAGWISNYCKSKKLKLEEGVALLLGEYLGADLSKIVNELEKVSINLESNEVITKDLVERNIGISKEYNVFELQKAIAFKDLKRISSILSFMKNNPKKNPPVLIISSLGSFFTRIYQGHFFSKGSDKDISSHFNLRHPSALSEFKTALKNYPLPMTMEVIHLLKTFDLYSKGVGYNATGKEDIELLEELIWKIINQQLVLN